ncbi:hypothetical protein [Methanothrix sp.]|uniref:hypothetical protein n=1 Tax=Methanothrix sp. TaxID=90426 RepID=UPI0032976449
MKYAIPLIMAILGLSLLTPAIWAKQPFLLSSSTEDGNESDYKTMQTEANARFTPSIDEFLDDNLTLSEANLVNSQNSQITPSIGIFMSDQKLSSIYLDSNIMATPFIGSFLNDNWVPSSFIPPNYAAPYPNRLNTTFNSTNSTYNLLNSTRIPSSNSLENVYWHGEIGYLYSFLDPSWTPSNSSEINPQSDVPFKKHVMN